MCQQNRRVSHVSRYVFVWYSVFFVFEFLVVPVPWLRCPSLAHCYVPPRARCLLTNGTSGGNPDIHLGLPTES